MSEKLELEVITEPFNGATRILPKFLGPKPKTWTATYNENNTIAYVIIIEQ